MRTKDELFEFDKIAILLQYLYLDKEHTITFFNGICNLTIRMTDDYCIEVRNENFPDLGFSNFTDMMTVPAMLGIIDQLTKEEASSNYFKNKWLEIETITKDNLSLNHLTRTRH